MIKYDSIAILIPTYNPTDKLVNTVNILKDNGFKNIILVNDGSVDNSIFSLIEVSRILVHKENLGKGAALKTGFLYLKNLKYDGVITVDDDLQQDILDIRKIADSFLEKEGIYFGVRNFENAPFLRKVANKITAKLFKILYKNDICDTQTGLRCFPKHLLSQLANINGFGFEYEMNVLKYLSINNFNIKKINIKTVYDDNKSHFHVIKDSFKIIRVLLTKKYI